jgi:hypothetical protein
MKKPFELILLYGLHIFLATGALYGGTAFIIAPNGSLLGMSEEWISGTFFHSFIIPGILLIIFLGILPILSIFGLRSRGDSRILEKLNIYKNRHWAWSYSLYTGIIAIIWIVCQQLLTSYFILQPIISATGLLIILVTISPRVQKYYEVIS